MAISNVALSNEQSHPAQNNKSSSAAKSKKSGKKASLKSVDASILASKVNSLQLVYQAAVAQINEQLEVEFGPNALDYAVQADVDVSPDVTAAKIISLSTGFLEAFTAQHPDENEDFVLQNFMDSIRDGIDQGFAEARDILESLAVLQGSIIEDVDETFLLVQDGLLEFEEKLRGWD